MAGASVYFVRVDPSKAITPDKPRATSRVGMMGEALMMPQTMVNHLYHRVQGAEERKYSTASGLWRSSSGTSAGSAPS